MNAFKNIRNDVFQAAANLLEHKTYVSPLDVLVNIGVLHPVHLEDWKTGKIPYLESVFEKDLDKTRYIMRCLFKWAHQKGLKPKETLYLRKGNTLPHKNLDFTKNGHPKTELLYHIHFTPPHPVNQNKQTFSVPMEKPLVTILPNPDQCSQCRKSLIQGNLCCFVGKKPFCLSCGEGMVSHHSKFKTIFP